MHKILYETNTVKIPANERPGCRCDNGIGEIKILLQGVFSVLRQNNFTLSASNLSATRNYVQGIDC